jgi:translocation protein SEC66
LQYSPEYTGSEEQVSNSLLSVENLSTNSLAEKTAYESWFPPHPARDVYISLLSSPTPVPESLIKSALLVRASADVKRIWRLREDKMALTNLHQRGLLGDETLSRFEAAEKELEAEIVDVVQEANTFRQGWGGMIFATATEMAQAERTREIVINIGRVKAEEGASSMSESL